MENLPSELEAGQKWHHVHTHKKHCTKWQITFSFYVLNYKFVVEVVVWCMHKTRSSSIDYYNLNELNSRTRKKKTPFIL